MSSKDSWEVGIESCLEHLHRLRGTTPLLLPLLIAFLKALSESLDHVQTETGPVLLQVKLYRRDKLQPLQAEIEITSKKWRVES